MKFPGTLILFLTISMLGGCIKTPRYLAINMPASAGYLEVNELNVEFVKEMYCCMIYIDFEVGNQGADTSKISFEDSWIEYGNDSRMKSDFVMVDNVSINKVGTTFNVFPGTERKVRLSYNMRIRKSKSPMKLHLLGVNIDETIDFQMMDANQR